MRVLGATAALVLVMALAGTTGPTAAQSGGGGGSDSPHINMLADTPSKTPEEKEAEAAKEKAYKESLKKIPDAKAPSDPWGSVRSDAPKAPPAKSASTAAKTKTKTGSNAN
jgi:hypothetical protein